MEKSFVVNSSKLEDLEKISRQMILASQRYCKGWNNPKAIIFNSEDSSKVLILLKENE